MVADANGDGFTELVTLENTVLGAKAFYKPGNRSKLSIDFSVLNEYRRDGNWLDLAPHFTDITEELDHNTFFGGIDYKQWNKDYKGKFAVYASVQTRGRGSYYGGLGGGRTAQDSLLALNAYGQTDDLALITGGQYNYYFNNDDVLTLGVENQYYDTRDEIQGYRRLVDQQVNTTGLFAQYEWKPNEKITTLLGARYDISKVDGDYQIDDVKNKADVNIAVFTQVNLLIEGFYTQLQNPFTEVSTGAILPNGAILEEMRNGEGVTVSGFNFEAGYSPSTKLAFQLGGTAQQARYNENQVLFEPEGGGGEAIVSVNEFVRNPNFYEYFTAFYNFSEAFKIDLTGAYTGSMLK